MLEHRLVLRGLQRKVPGRAALPVTRRKVFRIIDGIRDRRASGSILGMPVFLALKAEAMYFAYRTREALESVEEAQELGERFEERRWSAELHRLKGVFLTAMGADETQIEASFCAAISTAKEQKSVSLEKRAEATYAEYRRQKASGPQRIIAALALAGRAGSRSV